MIASIPSAVLLGVDGRPVSVEVHVSNGLPGLTVVGLPDAAVRESRDRVRAALASSGLAWPRRRITVNLAPSGMRKAGAGLDLAIAVGVLVASGVLAADAVAGTAFVGELGLDGSLRGVPGAMVLADALADRRLVVADAEPRRGPVGRWRLPRRPRRCPSSSPAAPDGARGPSRHRPEAATGRSARRRQARRATSPTSWASRWPGAPSRWPPPAATTCCWSDHRGRARPCWPSGWPGLLPTSTCHVAGRDPDPLGGG